MRTYPVKDMLDQVIEAGDLVTWGVKSDLTIGKAEYKLYERYVDSNGTERMLKVDDPAAATHCKFTVRRIFNMGSISVKNIHTGETTRYWRGHTADEPSDWIATRASPIDTTTHFLKLDDPYAELLKGRAAV